MPSFTMNDKDVEDIKAFTMDPPKKKSLNPYLNARRAWNESWAVYESREKLWKSMCMTLSLTLLVAIVCIFYISNQQKTIPYIVEVDYSGRILAVKGVDRFKGEDTRIIASLLATFVSNLRSIYSDPVFQEKAIYGLYAHLTNGTPAITAIGSAFKNDSPFEKAKHQTVTVEILSVLPASETNWEVEWKELYKNKSGADIQTKFMKGIATLSFSPPDFNKISDKTQHQAVLQNPIGMFVTDFNWTGQYQHGDNK